MPKLVHGWLWWQSSPPPLSQIQGVATGRDVIAAAAGAARALFLYGWPQRQRPSPGILKATPGRPGIHRVAKWAEGGGCWDGVAPMENAKGPSPWLFGLGVLKFPLGLLHSPMPLAWPGKSAHSAFSSLNSVARANSLSCDRWALAILASASLSLLCKSAHSLVRAGFSRASLSNSTLHFFSSCSN